MKSLMYASVLLLITGKGHAATKSESKPLDLPDLTAVAQTQSAKPKVNFDMKCESRDGQSLRPGQMGFDSCMGDHQLGSPEQAKQPH